MDTSKAYIKMCDCEKVQGQWEPKEGDWGYSMRNGAGVIIYKTMLLGNFLGRIKHDFIWLPRQDQLQEMLKNKWRYLNDLLYALASFQRTVLPPHSEVESYEQLWLKFYVWDKHNKRWNGKEWVKCSDIYECKLCGHDYNRNKHALTCPHESKES